MNTCPTHGQSLTNGKCTVAGMTMVCFYERQPEHFLIVGRESEEDGELSIEIEHPKECPANVDRINGIERVYHGCPAEYAIYEGMADNYPEMKTPGRYLIEVGSWKCWTDYGWEHDGEVYLTAPQSVIKENNT